MASELEDYDGLIPFKDQATGLYGFMDLAGKTVIPALYTTVPDPFENGWAEVNDGRGHYYNALIDQLGGHQVPGQKPLPDRGICRPSGGPPS